LAGIGAVVAVGAALAVAGCGDEVGSALEDTLRGTLESGGLENPITRAPQTYEGTFRLADDRFLCALLPQGAYCVTDDGTATVNVTDAGEVTSGQVNGRQAFPAGERRDIGAGDVLVNQPGTMACGSGDDRSLWCIAVEPGKGFAVDGSTSGFVNLSRD
jgi:hypothetical protein